jgi:hypothetical protein
MSRAIAARFQRWFEHECHAHEKVLRSLESVPADRRAGPEFAKAVAILAHVAAARRGWLVLLGIFPGQQGTRLPEKVTLAEAADLLRSVHGPWAEYLARVTDEEIGREVEYQSLDEGWFRNRVEDVLAQLFAHSS